ncbi:diguanylate cyclase [Arsukibacterium sp.]|uniref:diguanylate cyclase n=1 Tax=Arsukibacterium sp. TaxID=1977258 RepID=UPI002FD94964
MTKLLATFSAIAAISLLLCSFLLQAEVFAGYHQRLWSPQQGLPQTSVLDIAQDADGYLWLATEGGLARFDGERFDVFDGRRSPLFSNPLLRSLLVSSDGSVWVGSSDKLLRGQQLDFAEITLAGRSLGAVEALAELPGDRVFIGADRLYLWQHEQLQQVALSDKPVNALLVDGEALWIGGPGYLAYWRDGHYQERYHSADSGQVMTRLLATDEGLLAATPQGLFIFDGQRLLKAELDGITLDDEVLLLHQDQQRLWVATYQQILLFEQGRLVSRKVRDSSGDFPWLVSAFNSQEGYIWFGSKSHGLLRLRADATSQFSVAAGLTDPFVWALAEHQQQLLVGYNQGLARFDGKSFLQVIDSTTLSHPVVYSLFIDKDQAIWAGTRRGLNKISADFQEVQRFSQLDHLQINGVAQTADGSIWIATFAGLFRLLPGETVPQLMNEPLGISNQRIRMLFVDSDDRLWIGTPDGAFYIEQGQLHRVADPQVQRHYISFISQLADGRMLLGALQGGIAVQQGPGWRWLTMDEGLPAADVIFATQVADRLLVSNFNGVYSINITALDGAPLDSRIIIDDFAAEAGRDGFRCCNGAGNSKGLLLGANLYLPTLDGVVAVNATELATKPKVAVAIIENLKAGNHYYRSASVNLPKGQRDLHFTFSSPIFYRPQSLVFRYRLAGYDRDWTEVTDRREAFYTNIPAGAYRFELQVRIQGEQQWSALSVQQLKIPALWHESYWLYLALLLGLFSVVYFLYRYRLQRMARQQAQLEMMVARRTHELDKANQQLAALNEQLQQLSITDALTGLNNRHYLQQVLKAVLAGAQRHGRPLQCILLDLDNFKQVNDLLGHQQGDELLKQMAALLKRLTRQSDHVIRWGGEEFLVIQEPTEQSSSFLPRLQQAILAEQWQGLDSLPFNISISAGVVEHPLPGWSWAQSLALADKALYLVKQHGKNGWLKITPIDGAQAAEILKQQGLALLQLPTLDYQASEPLASRLAAAFTATTG